MIGKRLDAAFEEIFRTELASHAARIDVLATIREGGRAGNDRRGGQFGRDGRRNVVHQGVGEIVRFRRVGQAGEGQDRDGKRLGGAVGRAVGIAGLEREMAKQRHRERRHQDQGAPQRQPEPWALLRQDRRDAAEPGWCRAIDRRRLESVGMDGAGDVLDLVFAEIDERELELAMQLLLDDGGHADAPRRTQGFEPGRDVDAVAEHVDAVAQHVARMDTDAKHDPLGLRDGRHRRLHLLLKVDGKQNRVDRARELEQKPVAGRLDQPPPIDGGDRRDAGSLDGLHLPQGADLVGLHHTAVADHVGRQDRRELAVECEVLRHGAVYGLQDPDLIRGWGDVSVASIHLKYQSRLPRKSSLRSYDFGETRFERLWRA